MSKYKNIIWDLDGTLMDTLVDLYLSVNYALEANNMPERTLDEVRRFVGNGVRRLMELAVPGGDSNPHFDKVFADFKQHYVLHCQDNSGFYAGIVDVLSQLRDKGVRMAVVSNKLQQGVTELSESLVRTVGTDSYVRLSDYVDVAIGESPDAARKPAPDMVYKAMQLLGAEKESTVYVGDSDVDISTARNAGLHCISVLWGFRDREFLLRHGAEILIDTPSQIMQYVV